MIQTKTPVHYEVPRFPRESVVLGAQRSWLSVILPERSENLVFDPEMLRFAISGNPAYTGVGCTITATAERQRRGVYSIRVTNLTSPATGIAYAVPQVLVANQPYTFSCDHYGYGDYLIYIEDAVSNIPLVTRWFKGQNFWQRVAITTSQGEGNLVRVGIYASPNPLNPSEYRDGFFVDGFQLEAKAYATTFISGDQGGFAGERPNPYGWFGNPHNSGSFRLRSTRSGGRAVPLDDLGYQVMEISGLGMVDPDNIINNYAQQHGGSYACSRIPAREWSVNGFVCEIDGILDLHCTRQNLIKALTPLRGRQRLPVRLQYQILKDDEPLTPCLEIDAVYASGLNMRLNNEYIEQIQLEFISPDPFIHSCGDAAAELSVPDAEVSAEERGMLVRNETGGWGNTEDLPLVDYVIALETGPDGYLYGLFVEDFGGGGETYTLRRWTGKEWIGINTLNNTARALCATPDGYIYVTGGFTGIGGVGGSFFRIARYNTLTQTWDNLGTSVISYSGVPDSPVGGYALAYHPSGRVIVAGYFDTAQNTTTGSITANNVAAYNITTDTWETLGESATEGLPFEVESTVIDIAIYALAISPAGGVVAGGRWTNSYGAIHNLALFDYGDPSGWRTIDSPLFDGEWGDAYVKALAFANNGRLYVGGRFNDTQVNNYEGLLIPPQVREVTNIGWFSQLGGDLDNFVFERMRPIQQGMPESYLYYPGGTPTEINSEVRTIAASCSGEVWIGGSFAGVYSGYTIGGSGRFLPSVGVATFQQDHIWRPPEIHFIPAGYSVDDEDTPLIEVNAIEFGRRCDPIGIMNPFGGGEAGDDVEIGDPDAPVDFLDTLYVGIMVNETNAPYILFPARSNVDIGCSVEAKPILYIRGPGALRSIINRTTGARIDFNNYPLLDGEVLILDLNGRPPRAYSSANKNAFNVLTQVSQLSNFLLVSGNNAIDISINNLLQNGTISPDTRAWIEYAPRYESIDAACVAECDG